MKQPLINEKVAGRVPFSDCLDASVTWWKTKNSTAIWRAEVGPQIWEVRVNDFPEDHLYTLLIDNQEVGNFDEWPDRWNRAVDAPRHIAAEKPS